MTDFQKEVQRLNDCKTPFEVKYTEKMTLIIQDGFVYTYDWISGAFCFKCSHAMYDHAVYEKLARTLPNT